MPVCVRQVLTKGMRARALGAHRPLTCRTIKTFASIPPGDANGGAKEKRLDASLSAPSSPSTSTQSVSGGGAPPMSTQRSLAALLAFGLVAADVEGVDRNWHLLLPYDQALFALAASLPPPDIIFARTTVSDTPIDAALYAWAAALALGTLRPGSRRGVWEASFFAFVALMVNANVVSFLKDAFMRPRPEAVLASYAFPSGHTTAACFGWGVLFLSILPAAFPELRAALRREGGGLTPLCVALWATPTVVTATGRIIGEAHWLSDTVAGAAVGVVFASLADGAANAARRARGDENHKLL